MRAVYLLLPLLLLCLVPAASAQTIFTEKEGARGAAASGDLPHGGQTCLVWNHGKAASMAFAQVPTDWTSCDTLSLWLRTPTAAGASFMIIVPSENEATEGSDYYSYSVRVEPGDWKHLSLRLGEDLSPNRQPLGWKKIEGMSFTASGWAQTLNPEAVVYVDDVELQKNGPVVGPRLSDEEFFGALDPGLAALAGVRAAVVKRDFPAARAAYVAYLRSLPHPWSLDWRARPAQPEAKPNTQAADEAMARRYTIVSVPYDFQGGDIDWTVNPTDPVNHEWIWQFSRHHWWPQLGRAYWATGDEKYAREFVYNVEDWVHDCPVPSGRVSQGAGSRWRTIECGIRMAGSWPSAFFYFLSSPSFTEGAVIDMVKSMVEHARYLTKYPTSGNWLTMECNGLYHVGALFPRVLRGRRVARYRGGTPLQGPRCSGLRGRRTDRIGPGVPPGLSLQLSWPRRGRPTHRQQAAGRVPRQA